MSEPLLQIDGLCKTFHVAKSASGNTRLKALDGISLTVGPRGNPGPGRGVGLRKIHAGPDPHDAGDAG